MAANLEEIVSYFHQKCANVSQILELRGIDDSGDSLKTMQAINDEVTEVEEILNDFRKELTKQRKLLKHAETVKKALEGFEQRSEYISKNLPQHLPGNKLSKGPERAVVLAEKGQLASTTVERKPKVKVANYHKIGYLTTEEFDSVPKYLKGRLDYTHVNNAIDQIHQALAAKYKILSTKRIGMGEHVMKKYREFKEQETAETKGCYFFINKDLKEFSSFKLDKVGQSILNILRHCGKLKEVRSGKLVRFVVLP
ncbi:spindle and kinetochore-associated protein 1-like [Dendronephthya gigantea]|uniref:spindle and kinetochore-associated protein 1-like n=1 Tax=Dendronephthya gigantea TaxID=151771 RepID=UPI00106C08E3|nr:spindle and kinetochore-associated protein 1-like [Dendronephthya gigantea]